jgi:hypothetical protein
VTAVLFTFSSAGRQFPATAPSSTQEPAGLLKLSPAEEKDTYQIYSAELRHRKPSVEAWKIMQETRPFTFCLKPTQNLASTYRSVLDDYTMKNQSKLILERKFDLPAYSMVSSQEWFQRSGPVDLATVSAVGLNRDRTRAGVCYSVGSSAGSAGTCLFLVKQSGNWEDDKDNPQGCGFGGAVYR